MFTSESQRGNPLILMQLILGVKYTIVRAFLCYNNSPSMSGIIRYVEIFDGKYREGEELEKVENLKIWELEKSSYALIKSHLSLIGDGKKNRRV